jgi:hypothetical protein
MTITEVEAEEIRVRALIKRCAITTRAIRVLAFLRSPAMARPPLLDRADRDAREPGHLAVDQTLAG